MENSLVSIIVPTYNYAQFLPECLQSILNQSYSNWEAIIIDDGSTDNTKDVVVEYVQNDSRINYFYQENQGVSAARNLGIGYSKGNYIQFLDADDLIEPKKIEVHVKHLESSSYLGLVYGPAMFFDHRIGLSNLFASYSLTQNAWMPKLSLSLDTQLEHLITRNIMVISSPLMRRSIVDIAGLFDTSLVSMEDWEYWIRLTNAGCLFKYVSENLDSTLIRVHGNSATGNLIGFYENELKLRLSMKDVLTGGLGVINDEKIQIAQDRIYSQLQISGFKNIYQGDFRLGLNQILKLQNLIGKRTAYWKDIAYWTMRRLTK